MTAAEAFLRAKAMSEVTLAEMKQAATDAATRVLSEAVAPEPNG
jgi:hypothetical protein